MKNLILMLFVFTVFIMLPSQAYAFVFYPMADASVSSGSPDVNFNNCSGDLDSELWTGTFSSGEETLSYLKFNLSDVLHLCFAYLWLYSGVDSGARSSFSPSVVEVFSVPSNWRERGITWNNKPESQSVIGSALVDKAGWYRWDISSFAEGNRGSVVSLGLVSDGAAHIYYARETELSECMPYLQIVVPEPPSIFLFSSFIIFLFPGIKKRLFYRATIL